MTNHKYLLDTNIVSDLVRNPQGLIAGKIVKKGEKSVCTNIIVASELRFGAWKKFSQTGSERLVKRVELILSAMDILQLEEPADRHYAEIRTFLEQNGTPIGGNDLLIAAHARASSLTVVSANYSEFSRVPGLMVDNWL